MNSIACITIVTWWCHDRQPAFDLGIFKGTLDLVTLPLHLGKEQKWRISRGIGHAVFDGFLRFHLTPDNQVPASRCLFLTIPDLDPPVCDIDPQLPTRGVAQNATHPLRCQQFSL
jgi:hypothetical protein